VPIVRVDFEEHVKGRKTEIEPRRVVFKVVSVRKHPFRNAPCTVQMVELVWVEVVDTKQREPQGIETPYEQQTREEQR
jgi:hypothetical protein